MKKEYAFPTARTDSCTYSTLKNLSLSFSQISFTYLKCILQTNLWLTVNIKTTDALPQRNFSVWLFRWRAKEPGSSVAKSLPWKVKVRSASLSLTLLYFHSQPMKHLCQIIEEEETEITGVCSSSVADQTVLCEPERNKTWQGTCISHLIHKRIYGKYV